MAILLGPVMVAGAAVCAIALLQLLVSGWNPFEWATDPTRPGTWLDWAFGPSSGSAARYVVFIAGGMTAALSYSAIAWGFHGRNRIRTTHL
jgi:hypothetical protein